MGKTKKTNQGFSLIELLIAITILSIIMMMVSQFMSTTSGAYRKTKKNMNVQTEAMQVVEQMADTLMQAEYVRVESTDGKLYTITKNATNKNERVITDVTPATGGIDYGFVPDNYPNYCKSGVFSGGATERKIIVDFDTFELKSEAGDVYPITGDIESGANVRSFRALKDGASYNYIMPRYIYVEYTRKNDAGSDATVHVMYYITDADANTGMQSVYLYRAETSDYANNINFLYTSIAAKACTQASTNGDGLVTEHLSDFYLSADAEGNAFLVNMMFENGGYRYNAVETINFRNSNVLTVRPQKLYKVKGTGVKNTP